MTSYPPAYPHTDVNSPPQQPPYAPYPGPQQPYVGQMPSPVQQNIQPVVVIGGCPICKVGAIEDNYTCLGICLAILFFPLGILCCLALKQRRCINCHSVFG